jgi:hypothetical protein
VPAPDFHGRFVEAGLRRVPPLAINDDLLAGFGELLPGLDLGDVDADLIEQALAVQEHVAEEEQRGDVLLAVEGAGVPPRLGEILLILLRPLLERRVEVFQ